MDYRGLVFLEVGMVVLGGMKWIFGIELDVVIYFLFVIGVWEVVFVNILFFGDVVLMYEIGYFVFVWKNVVD